MTHVCRQMPVAIVGMACHLPGADGLDEFWTLIREGRRAWGPVPAARFDRDLYYLPERAVRGKSYTDLGGLVTYRAPDCRLCPIPAERIDKLDVAHVTLCEVAGAALRHAGLDAAGLLGAQAGVYVGHARASGLGGEMTYAAHIAQAMHYLNDVEGFDRLPEAARRRVVADVIAQVHTSSPHPSPDGSPYLAANMAAMLISQTFGLDGPAMVFNAACASSAHAVVQAVRALQLGRIDMAVVGGASYFHSDTLVLFSQAQSVSATGSYPFTASADGMVVAEGYVSVILKMLDRALADGDRICAVIPSVSLSSDGRGKSLWTPRREGQIEAIRRAYGNELPLGSLQYMEAHATSTSVGDATELRTLSEVFDGQLEPGRKIALGSVKANIGHTLEAAGLSSLVKTVLALQNRTIPPATDGRQLNGQVEWDSLAVSVPTTALPWPDPETGQPRRAGVNAFGIGGLNVHIVLEEAPQAASRPQFRASDKTGTGTSRNVGLAPYTGPCSEPVPVLSGGRLSLQRPSRSDEAVAVVGMGAIFPGAHTVDAFWDLLTSGRDARTDLPSKRWNGELYHDPQGRRPWGIRGKLGGFVSGYTYDWRKHKIPPKQVEQASPLQFMILDAVDQAMNQAGYNARQFNRQRTGVVVGTMFGGDFSGQLAVALHLPALEQMLLESLLRHGVPPRDARAIVERYPDILLKHMPALLDETGSFTASALASRITKSFDLMGGAVALDAGSGSSFAAMNCAIDQLLSGDCEVMVCVGGQQSLSPLIYALWSVNNLLATGRTPAPFDADAAGSVPGEGCGAVLLKREADARRDGDKILGIIRGFGSARQADASKAIQAAIRRSLDMARVRSEHVAAVETSGAGRADFDAAEVEGICGAYGRGRRRQPLRLGTAVGQIGRAGGAAGMASLIKAVLQVEHGRMPAISGLAKPADYVARRRPVLEAAQTSSDLPADDPEHAAMIGVNSGSAFEVIYHAIVEGGTNMSLQPEHSLRATTAGGRLSRIVHYDATERRREAMRQKASSSQRHTGNGSSNGNGQHHELLEPVAEMLSPPEEQVMPPLDRSELEKFLIDFVVEQTGYPPEIVALDADLEADLGIDSIKKAQLFGELGQHFQVEADKSLTLDDFPTLAHVRDYLLRATGRSSPSIAAAEAKPAHMAPPVHVAQPSLAVAKQGSETSSQSPAAPATDPAELERFLVNFVVEQTGYPPEIVELDADLEADLGIDSIKKAQLFGELGQYFHIEPDRNLTLDDFPTLRHVYEYLARAIGGASRQEQVAKATPRSMPAALASPARTGVQSSLAARAMQHRNETTTVAKAAPQAPQTDPADLDEFLVNFVVEQTGYPPEIVDLDADLEADLGIDSIKKAQLFGELGQHFQIEADRSLTLDDFPTLRHVRDYLAERLAQNQC